MHTHCNSNGLGLRIMDCRRRHKKYRNGRHKRGNLKSSRGSGSKMHAFTVKCLEAFKSVTVSAENHKDAAQKSGLAVPGVTLSVDGLGVWRRFNVDQLGRIKEISNYSGESLGGRFLHV